MLFSKIIIYLLLNILTLRRKKGVYLYSSKNIKVLLKIQWIFVILLSLFVIRNFTGPCSSVEMLKGYMVRERLGTPGLGVHRTYHVQNFLKLFVEQFLIILLL